MSWRLPHPALQVYLHPTRGVALLKLLDGSLEQGGGLVKVREERVQLLQGQEPEQSSARGNQEEMLFPGGGGTREGTGRCF